MARIVTGFGFQSTAADVAEGVDLGGRHAIVTGGASGIGVETARELARAGAAVTLAVRDSAAGQRTAADITVTTGNPDVSVAMLDLADQRSVAAFVQAWDEPLHLLVNNAGIIGSSEHRTPEGWELQFAANHLGHFALAHGLHGALAAAGRHGGARIVVVSSSGHLFSPVVFDDVHFAYRPYDPLLAYAQSRTANVLFAVGATARWAGEGITANALHPGASGTNPQRCAAGQLTVAPELRKTPQQGAATSLLLATSPLLEGVGGRYFNDCNEAVVVDHRPSDLAERFRSVAVYALDPDAADRLWETSLCLTRLTG